MRLADITTVEEANAFLETYLPRFDQCFARPPLSRDNLTSSLAKGSSFRGNLLCQRQPSIARNYTEAFNHNEEAMGLYDGTVWWEDDIQTQWEVLSFLRNDEQKSQSFGSGSEISAQQSEKSFPLYPSSNSSLEEEVLTSQEEVKSLKPNIFTWRWEQSLHM